MILYLLYTDGDVQVHLTANTHPKSRTISKSVMLKINEHWQSIRGRNQPLGPYKVRLFELHQYHGHKPFRYYSCAELGMRQAGLSSVTFTFSTCFSFLLICSLLFLSTVFIVISNDFSKHFRFVSDIPLIVGHPSLKLEQSLLVQLGATEL